MTDERDDISVLQSSVLQILFQNALITYGYIFPKDVLVLGGIKVHTALPEGGLQLFQKLLPLRAGRSILLIKRKVGIWYRASSCHRVRV